MYHFIETQSVQMSSNFIFFKSFGIINKGIGWIKSIAIVTL